MTRLLLTLVIFLCTAPPTWAEEAILDFHSDITVNADGHLSVSETIKVRAEGREIKRGIYRDFPTLYRNWLGFRTRVPFDVISVTRDGKPEPYRIEPQDNGERVYFGEANVFLESGIYTYRLTYTTDRQLGYFADHDELYWNVTGNGWSFPILKASALVYPPTDASTFKAYTGREGQTLADYTGKALLNGAVRFETTVPLASREGLTIVIEWPKGYVRQPSPAEQRWNFWLDNRDLLVAGIGLVLVLVYYIMAWHNVGRDPQAGVIVPHYEPPEKLSPGAVRFIRRMGYDDKTFASALVNLAVSGALGIAEDGDSYVLTNNSAYTVPLAPAEEALRKQLFSKGERLELKQKNHAVVRAARKEHESKLRRYYEKLYFRTNRVWLIPGALVSLLSVLLALALIPGEMRFVGFFLLAWLCGWSFGVHMLARGAIMAWRNARSTFGYIAAFFSSLFALPFLLGELFGLTMFAGVTSVGFIFVLMLTAATHFVFLNLMKAPTLAGRRLMDRMDGFKLYLTVAEGDELKRSTLPQDDIRIFERFFPYALAMDVEQQWSERFADTFADLERQGQRYAPGWYRSPHDTGAFSPAFATAMGSALSGAIAASSTAPGSSSGGGGGGSSGGGGGGGGGGGW